MTHDHCEVYVQRESGIHWASLRCSTHQICIQWLTKIEFEELRKIGISLRRRPRSTVDDLFI